MKLHFVWVGTEMPQREKDLWEKNRQVLEGFEINVIQDYSLVPDEFMPYVSYVESTRKWAFISDILKVLALKKYGGWVSDADVEFFKKPTFTGEWVSGFENWRGQILANTAVWGAPPNHPFTDRLLETYRQPPQEVIKKPNTKWISDLLISQGAILNNEEQYIKSVDVRLYPHQVFCGPKLDHSVSVHHFNGSWLC
jgi:mannosyltransferase OCH1-like enzyme